MVYYPVSVINCTNTALLKYPGKTILPISTSDTNGGFQAVVLLQREFSSMKQSPRSLLGKQHSLTCCAAYLGRGATGSAGVVMAESEGIRVTSILHIVSISWEGLCTRCAWNGRGNMFPYIQA